MTRRQLLFAVIAMLSLPLWGWAVEGQGTQSGNQAPEGQVFGDIGARTNGEPVLLEQSSRYAEYDARFGWWAMSNEGSPAKTGEYQDLKPSPFWDLDGLSSDGRQTLNVYGTGTDNETSKAGLNYYRGNTRVNVDYDRFIHRLDHDPINNIPNSNSFSGNPVDPKIIKQDLNVGQDYAVRVQELKASFKGKLSDNLKARLDVWGMQKDGTRQVNAVAMCYGQTASTPPPGHPPITAYSGSRCHVLSQMQQIDWITTEIKPVIEARLGDNFTVEYSRPMRNFTSADSATTRYYDGVGKLSYNAGNNPNPYEYAVVPDSYTQMDQLKISGQLTDNTKAYAFLMVGNTINEEINMERWFNDADIRLTNTSIENVSLTGYGKIYNEDESMPNLANVTAVNQGAAVGGIQNILPTSAQVASAIVHPIDYHKSTAGAKGVWRPWGGGYAKGGLAIVGGYEYCDLERQYATYTLSSGSESFPAGGVINEARTITNSFQVGPDCRWSACFDTYLHYKYQSADQPLFGIQPFNGIFNTKLPKEDNIVEIGFNWVPSDWFIFNACVGIERADNQSQYANFDEENYPMSFTAWYAASKRLSLSVGYAVYSNYVGQEITVADQSVYTGSNSSSASAPVTSKWNYGGQAHVVTLDSRYATTERVTLTGQVEWVRGHDLINNSALGTFPGNVTIYDLGGYSEVLNETTRVTMGVDWVIYPRVVNYYRYELYNFLDKAPGYQTGTAQGIMGGLSAMF